MDSIYNFDFWILDALQKIHCTVLNYFMAFFTYLGEGGFVWIAAAVLMLVIRKTRKMGCAVSLALVFELLINEKLIKPLVARPRPFTLNPDIVIESIVHKPSSYSFPSGHTCTAFAAATAIYAYDKRLGLISYAAAVLIGFSRNYFYIHFPTDVLCGAFLGFLLGLAAATIAKIVQKRIAEKKQNSQTTA